MENTDSALPIFDKSMGTENRENHPSVDADIQSAINSIRNVGSRKPVGYLPIDTIIHYIKMSPEALISECKARGLETRIFTGREWPGFNGSLYVYDRNALQELLHEDRDVLVQAGWPTDADAFVSRLHENVPIGTPLFKLIARAFGDTFSENLEP